MANIKHTPLPWRVRDDGKSWAIIGAEPSWIGDIDKRNHNAATNAEFIIRACNSHYELMEALKTIEKMSCEIGTKIFILELIAKMEGK